MQRVYCNKLIRDGIPDKITGKGESYSVRKIADNNEFQQELLKKVVEEAHGLSQSRSRDEFISEYADVMVALDTLTQLLEISPAELEVAMQENIAKKGWYQKQLFL